MKDTLSKRVDVPDNPVNRIWLDELKVSSLTKTRLLPLPLIVTIIGLPVVFLCQVSYVLEPKTSVHV
jgi:hypothetical protein